MTSYYEMHITMLGDKIHLKKQVESIGWKFSAIDGDPVLGDGIKCYATTFFNDRFQDVDAINHLRCSADYLKELGVKVIRQKVEKVIYDDRSTKVRCNGACVECHLDDYVK